MSNLSIAAPDRLRVFVSSTIDECKEERAQAARAITSLNHEPFLFERAGARPFSPRELYLPKLQDSQVFLAIYKLSYGWIAPGEAISGLEDEYRSARAKGMPCLVYIQREALGREPLLAQLINDIKQQSSLTYSLFDKADELYHRIRDDIEAEVSRRFTSSEQWESIAQHDAGKELDQILRGQILVIRYTALQQVLEAMRTARIVQLYGDAGSGKTTLVASVARDEKMMFVSASLLSPLEVANAIASKLSLRSKRASKYYVTLDAAYSAVRDAWAADPAAALALDGLEDANTLGALFPTPNSIGISQRVLYSVRTPMYHLRHRVMEIPPFTREESSELLSSGGRHLSSEQMEALLRVCQGNPLLLRYCLESTDSDCTGGLEQFETARWVALSPRGREITSYVALTRSRLLLADLIELVAGSEVSPETITVDIADAKWFLTEDVYGYAIRHEHQRTTVLHLLSQSAQKHSYYARAAAKLLQRRGDYVAAFNALESAGISELYDVARAAAFDAARRGDLRNFIHIGRWIVRAEREGGDQAGLARLLLDIAYAEQQIGHKTGSTAALVEAEGIAKSLQREDLSLLTREGRIRLDVFSSWSADSVAAMYEVRETYRSRGDIWSFGRITLDVCVMLIRTDRYQDAADQARIAVDAFQEVGDEYGVSLAKRNLASALTGIPGSQSDAAELIAQLRPKSGETESRRERAWLCNVMCRRFRLSRDYEKAIEYANEAIAIGTDLGDEYVVAINEINLGNVWRDAASLEEALRHYHLAAAAASKLADLETEATASRLSSCVYLDMEKAEISLQFASHSVALLNGTSVVSGLAECLEQLGDAYEHLGREQEAAEAYIRGAEVAKNADPEDAWRLAGHGMDVFVRLGAIDQYVIAIDRMCGREEGVQIDGDLPIGELLVHRIPRLLGSVDQRYAIPVLGVLYRLVFNNVPAPIAQFLFEHISTEIASGGGSPSNSWRVLFGLMPLLAALPSGGVSIPDTVALGEQLSASVPGLHYKPQADGAPHWNLVLNYSEAVLCTVSGLAGEAETAVVSTLIALFLKGFEKDVKDRIFGTGSIGQREVRIVVGCSTSVPSDIAPHVLPQLGAAPFMVTRPTGFQKGETLPTIVIFRAGITEEWMPGSGKGSSMHGLLSRVLLEVVFQCFQGEIELDVLEPKILLLIRHMVS